MAKVIGKVGRVGKVGKVGKVAAGPMFKGAEEFWRYVRGLPGGGEAFLRDRVLNTPDRVRAVEIADSLTGGGGRNMAESGDVARRWFYTLIDEGLIRPTDRWPAGWEFKDGTPLSFRNDPVEMFAARDGLIAIGESGGFSEPWREYNRRPAYDPERRDVREYRWPDGTVELEMRNGKISDDKYARDAMLYSVDGGRSWYRGMYQFDTPERLVDPRGLARTWADLSIDRGRPPHMTQERYEERLAEAREEYERWMGEYREWLRHQRPAYVVERLGGRLAGWRCRNW